MGRPKGSKNREGHRAGGARRGEKWATLQREKAKAARKAAKDAKKPGAVTPYEPPNPERVAESMTTVQRHDSMTLVPVDGTEPSVEDTPKEDLVEETEEQARYRMGALPPAGTPVALYLSKIREKCRIKSTDDGKERKFFANSHWVPPPICKLAGGPQPKEWHLSKTWVYIWLPLEQYPEQFKVPNAPYLQKHPCPWCGEYQTESKGLYWRSVEWWTRTVYVLHRRFQCRNDNCGGGSGDENQKGKKKSFASIDPNALSAIPKEVAERFECITSPKGEKVARARRRR